MGYANAFPLFSMNFHNRVGERTDLSHIIKGGRAYTHSPLLQSPKTLVSPRRTVQPRTDGDPRRI